MVHYIYKIHFLCGYPSGRYYIGKRTYKGDDIRKDKYTGSGNFCKAYFKKYGTKEGVTYIREILEVNPSRKINADREIEWIGTKYKDDKLCMNLCAGGINSQIHDSDYNNRPVRQYSIEGNFIKDYKSIQDAELELQINNIQACCAGRRHTAGGYQWRYVSDNVEKLTYKDSLCKQARAVKQYTLSGEFIREFESIRDAVNITGVDKKSIQECCIGRQKTGKGFIWKYVDPNYIRPCNRDLQKCGAIKVGQYAKDGGLISSWDSIFQASVALNCSPGTVAKYIRKNKCFRETYLKVIEYA